MKRMASVWSLGNRQKLVKIALEMSELSFDKGAIALAFLIDSQGLSRGSINKEVFIIDKHDLEHLTL